MSRKEFTLMRASQFFISTLKEAPADAEIISHKLMVRTGMIRRLGSGIYAYMPMGLRVIHKIENIIREEMNRAGAVELLMPLVQPAELWQETGRWQKYGPELLRIRMTTKCPFSPAAISVRIAAMTFSDWESGWFRKLVTSSQAF